MPIVTQAPRDARELSLVRAVFCLTLALFHLRDFGNYQKLVEQWHPYFTWPYREFPRLAHLYLEYSGLLGVLFILSLILAGVGICTRAALLTSTVLYFAYQAPIQTYLFYHDQTVAFWILAILSVAPSIDYWSLQKGRPREAKAIPDWPFILFKVAFVVMFFGAGVSKLLHAGLAWVDGHTLQYWLVSYHLWFKASLAWPLAGNLTLCSLASGSVLLLELGSPLFLLRERLFQIYLCLTFVFITVVYFVMDISFFHWFVICYIPFLPWKRFLGELPQEPNSANSGQTTAIVAIFLSLQLTPVIARTHAFPFTDYEIFAEYHTVADFRPIYRLAVPSSDGFHYFRETEWYEIHFAWAGDKMRGRGRGMSYLRKYAKQQGHDNAVILESGVEVSPTGELRLTEQVIKRLRMR